jgi:hypothetical protein
MLSLNNILFYPIAGMMQFWKEIKKKICITIEMLARQIFERTEGNNEYPHSGQSMARMRHERGISGNTTVEDCC